MRTMTVLTVGVVSLLGLAAAPGLHAATLDITSGNLTYTISSDASNPTITSAGGNYTITDSGETIALTTGATNAGWSGSGTNTVTGPISSVTGTWTMTLSNGGTGSINVNGTISGLTTVELDSGQNIVLNAGSINASSEVVLNAVNGSITESGTGTITASFLQFVAPKGSVTLNNSNAVGTLIESQSSGNFSLMNGQSLVVQSASGDYTGSSGGTVTITVTGSGNNLNVAAGGSTVSGVTVSLTASQGAVTADSGTNISATNLAISAKSGIGTTGTLTTAVSNLVAQNSTSGGMNITNTGALTIGFTGDPFQGVIDSGTGDQISLTNAGTINVTDGSVANEIISAKGSVSVTATGASANIVTGEGINEPGFGGAALQGSIVSVNGSVTLTAGQDLLIGNNATVSPGAVVAATNVVMHAGRNITLDDNSTVYCNYSGGFSGTSGTITLIASDFADVATAVANGNISLNHTAGAAFLKSNGGAITLTTGAGGTFTANQSAGGNITISADNMTLTDSPSLNALAGVVTLQPFTSSRPIALGSSSSSALSLTDTELGNVFTTKGLVIGSLTGTGGVSIRK